MAEVTVGELLKRIEGLEHIIGRSGLDQSGFLPAVVIPSRVRTPTVETDTINEKTSAAGVTIDSMAVKDGTITSLAGNDCIVVRVDKDGDGDFDPYTSTNWDNDSFSTVAAGTIDWNADFGVPDSAKMVCLYCSVRDSSASDDAGRIGFKAKSTTTTLSFKLGSIGGDVWQRGQGWVPVAPNGTSWYGIAASGTNTCDVIITVVAYAR